MFTDSEMAKSFVWQGQDEPHHQIWHSTLLEEETSCKCQQSWTVCPHVRQKTIIIHIQKKTKNKKTDGHIPWRMVVLHKVFWFQIPGTCKGRWPVAPHQSKYIFLLLELLVYAYMGHCLHLNIFMDLWFNQFSLLLIVYNSGYNIGKL